MDIFKSLTGMVTLELTSADPSGTLDALCAGGIDIYDVQELDELHVSFRSDRKLFSAIRRICEKRGGELRIGKRHGLFWTLRALAARPVLALGLAMYLALMLYLPGRVLFVRVEGNETVPANRIIEAAEGCGIRFGASRREVRSERIKNALLEAVPHLQWAGVNTSGCVATISVKERKPGEPPEDTSEFNHLVAARDSIILSCNATRGNLLCAPGQAVKAGQMLISGYSDLGLLIRASGAVGEVYGRTIRQITSVSPSVCLQKVKTGERKRAVSLIVGKKRINLWKDSGIWDTTCGRIYAENYITLPGGFRLPLALAVETFESAQFQEGKSSLTQQALMQQAEGNLLRQMIAGQILHRETCFMEDAGLYRLEGEYVCTEMIARVQRESIGEQNGENR